MRETLIFINNFNRLTSTRALAEWAASLAGARVVIVDNASDWPPLLEWYERCPFEVERLRQNIGNRAPWLCGAVARAGLDRYVVTDPDLDLRSCPPDLLEVMSEGLDRHSWAGKAGVGLEIDDVPPGYPSRALVLAIEREYWLDRVDERFFRAPVDTTFALYCGEQEGRSPNAALRSDRPYVARHLPWYVTPENLDDEERHYLHTADTTFSSGTSHTKAAYARLDTRRSSGASDDLTTVSDTTASPQRAATSAVGRSDRSQPFGARIRFLR